MVIWEEAILRLQERVKYQGLLARELLQLEVRPLPV